jgi:hypothetical protein
MRVNSKLVPGASSLVQCLRRDERQPDALPGHEIKKTRGETPLFCQALPVRLSLCTTIQYQTPDSSYLLKEMGGLARAQRCWPIGKAHETIIEQR